MPVSQYFNNYGAESEQRLIEDIIVESIKIMGFDAYYLPNDNDAARDLLYGEDPVKYFSSAFSLEMYLSNALEYGGEREFFSKFGLEIKNTVKVIISKRSFSERVSQTTFTRPREGDLVYVPFLNGTGELFEIKFTDQTKDFFMLGRKVPYFYELELEKFKYSQEILITGVAGIDEIAAQSAYSITLITDQGTGSFLGNEIVYQSPDGNPLNATAQAYVQSWTPSTNSLVIHNIAGEFLDGGLIIGASSNSQYYLSTFNPLSTSPANENFDNSYIATSANSVLIRTESNPFGSI
jgi:hypothetical protein